MPRNLKRYYGRGDLHFVTFSCYRRLPLLARRERRDLFLKSLETIREKYELVVVGYVVMPEHVHLLVGEPRKQNLSVALKALKQGVSRRVLKRLRLKAGQAKLFAGAVRLHHFWQARFYDFNVWSPKKRVEKLVTCIATPSRGALFPGRNSGDGAVFATTLSANPDLWR